MQASQVSTSDTNLYDMDYLETERQQYLHTLEKLSENDQVLDGMIISLKEDQDKFKSCGTFCLVLIFFTFIAHQSMKYFRFTNTNWQPDINAKSVAPWAKIVLDLVEKEFAPSLMVLVFSISTGATRVFAVILSLLLFCSFGAMFLFRKNEVYDKIQIVRVLIYILTIFLFIDILADNHIFEDETMAQQIEMSMTY